MAKRWTGLALVVGWLAASSWAGAQSPQPLGSVGGSSTTWSSAPPAPTPYGAPPGQPAPAAQGEKPTIPPPPLPPGPPPSLDGTAHFASAFCGPDCCDSPCTCATHFFVNFEYLLWWFKQRNLGPLVTTGSLSDTVPAALGQPNTHVFFGEGHDVDPFSGGRLWLGFWCDDDHTIGIEGNAFIMEKRSANQVISSNGDQGSLVLARPFFNVNAGTEDADPIAVPGVQAGTIVITQPRRFFGTEANFRWSQSESVYKHSRLSLLVGARYLNLDEKLEISESLVDLPGGGNPGNTTSLGENFTTYNRFYGGQIGAGWELHLGSVFMDFDGRVALGSNHQVTKISGFTTITEPDGTVTTGINRALLVQPSNAGRFSHSEFSVVPEFTFHLGYAFNEYLSFTVGYNFLYWHGVARSGENLDRRVAVPGLPNAQFGPPLPAGPTGPAHEGNFWAQGLSIGLGVNF
jgi:hypothetical protein